MALTPERLPIVRLDQPIYRCINRRFRDEPLKTGSVLFGGRLNAVGEEAFYASLDPATAREEVLNGLDDVRFTDLVFHLRSGPLADLRTEAAIERLGFTRDDLTCAWMQLAHDGQPVPSRAIAAAVRARGLAGIVHTSVAMPSGTNVVLFDWGAGEGAVNRLTLR